MTKDSCTSGLLASFEEQRFIFVGGKGGVGKTTTSASIALGLAQKYERVLIISTDPAHNLSDVLQKPVGKEIAPVADCPHLWAVETDPAQSIERFLRKHMTQPQSASLGQNPMTEVLDEVREWLSSLPGIDEAISLMQLFEAEKTLHERFDKLVIDTAPTGHTLKMLQLPKVLEVGIARLESWKTKLSGLIAMASMFLGGNSQGQAAQIASQQQLAEKLRQLKSGIQLLRGLLQDPKRCTFVCIGIAEALSVLETGRLVDSLHEFQINSHTMVINKLLTEKFSMPSERSSELDIDRPTKLPRREEKKQSLTDTVKTEAIATSEAELARLALELCRSRARIQNKYLHKLIASHGATHSIFAVQDLAYEPTGPQNLLSFLSSIACVSTPPASSETDSTSTAPAALLNETQS